MKNAISMIIQKSNYYNKHDNKQVRTLVLSTNVNDYDTGEPIVYGSIRKTLTSSSSQTIDNPILCKLNGIKMGRKYCIPISGQQNNDFLRFCFSLLIKYIIPFCEPTN
jgi:hypothetical protein